MSGHATAEGNGGGNASEEPGKPSSVRSLGLYPVTTDPRLNAELVNAWRRMDDFDAFVERLAGHGITPPDVEGHIVVGFRAMLLPGEDLSREFSLLWNLKPASLGQTPVQNPFAYFARHFPVEGPSGRVDALYSYVEASENAIDAGLWEDPEGKPFDATAKALELGLAPPDGIHTWTVSWLYGDPRGDSRLVWTAAEAPAWLLEDSPDLPGLDDGHDTSEIAGLARERGFRPPFDQDNASWHIAFTSEDRLVWCEPYDVPCRIG